MEKRLYLDIHVIQTVPPSCVNRDDTGSPKSATYGGVKRARVSSQSWKKAMREYFQDRFDESELGIRTVKIIELVVEQISKLDPTISSEDATKKAKAVIETAGIKVKDKDKDKRKSKDGAEESSEFKALFFISRKQIENIAKLALNGEYNKKDVQEAFNKGHGVDLALFGRMVADDPTLNVDASAQVAHSISTHKVDNEYDYFTAMDEKSPEDNAGAGMIGTVEFNSSTLYRYSTVAVHDLFKQLNNNSDATAKAVEEFARAFMMSMPTGKQNTFANRTVPDAVFISVRNDQPVNLVGAFESPIRSEKGNGGYVSKSVSKLAEYERTACSSFISAPIATWQIGTGLEELGPSSDMQTALKGLNEYISKEF